MLNQLFIKLYLFLLFIFIFFIFLNNYISKDLSYLMVWLYWLILIPFQIQLSKYFDNLIKKISIKNLFFNMWFLLFLISIIIWLIISTNTIIFLFIFTYIFLISFRINEYNLFFTWLLLFFVFIFYYFFYISDSVNYLVFSFYFLLSGILYYFINSIFNIKEFINKEKPILFIKLLLFLYIFLIFISIFFLNTFSFFPYLSLIILFILNFYNNIYIKNDSKNFYNNDLIILSLFIISFIPIINDYSIFSEKNKILLLTFLSFLFIYLFLNIVIKKFNKDKNIEILSKINLD